MCSRGRLLFFIELLLATCCCSLPAHQAHAKWLQEGKNVNPEGSNYHEAAKETDEVANALKEAEREVEEERQFEAKLLHETGGTTLVRDPPRETSEDMTTDAEGFPPRAHLEHIDAFDLDVEDADVALHEQDYEMKPSLSLLRATSAFESAEVLEESIQGWLPPPWTQELPLAVKAPVEKALARVARRKREDDGGVRHSPAQVSFLREPLSAESTHANWSNLAVGSSQHECVRYVLLTMQRSGSTWLHSELPKALPRHVRATWEGFNPKDGQAGAKLLYQAGLTPWNSDLHQRKEAMQRLGAMGWAQFIWRHLQTSTDEWLGPPLLSPCAVGFKIMGPDVDAFNIRDTEAILKDERVKKIILERRSTYDQWLSRQWACWSNDFSSHKPVGNHTTNTSGPDFNKMMEDGTWKAWTQDRARAGDNCSCGKSTRFETFLDSKNLLYSSWRNVLNQTDQSWLEIATEQLNDELLFQNISDYLLGSSNSDSSDASAETTVEEDGSTTMEE